MHRFKHTVRLVLLDMADALLRRRAPGQEHDAIAALFRDNVNHTLREALPAMVGVAVGLVGTHRQACVEQQHAAIGPRREQASFARRRFKLGIVLFDRFVDVG